MTTDNQKPVNQVTKFYARVQGNKIIEYPVSSHTIEQRGHSYRQYYPVIVDELDITNEAGMTFDTVLKIENMTVRVTHSKRQKTLAEIIEGFRLSHQNGTWTPHAYADIPDSEMRVFERLLGDHYEAKLEAVVKERYTSLDTLLGRYRNSNNPVWKKEADFIQSELDKLWSILVQYFAELKAGSKSLPVNVQEIEGMVPPTSWTSMP